MNSRRFTVEDIEVLGQALNSLYLGFGHFKSTMSKILLEHGIGALGPDGLVKIDLSQWYPMQSLIDAQNKVFDQFGESLIFAVGSKVIEAAIFPPAITDVHSLMGSMDVAYHLNHRKKGEIMFDFKTGRMLEGIGHYGYEAAGKNKIISVCENPYPCAFDRGVLVGAARRFQPLSMVSHDDSKPCRKSGASSCTYVITW